MSNTRQIQPIQIWTANGNKTVSILSLTNFFDYHFDDGAGKVSYSLIGLESTGTTTDENGNTINLPDSAIVYTSANINIPASIVQQWGTSDDVIWNYISQQLNLQLV